MERLQELERSRKEDGKSGKSTNPAKAATPQTSAPKPGSAQDREIRKQQEREARKIKNAIERLETEIAELESQLAEMDKDFIADPARCTVENCNKYEEIKRLAAHKTDEWAELQEQWESAGKGLEPPA